MKILHVHYTDSITRSGGGVIAMNRLHLGLKRANVQSRILARVLRPGHIDSVAFPRTTISSIAEAVLGRVTVRLGLNDIHCVSSFVLGQSQAYREADILNFHGLQGNYFSYLALPSISRQKAVVLTMHDMWPFTGHCAYSYDCERWQTGCGRCPYLDTTPAVRMDNTRLEWKLKDWIYSRSDISIVTLSKCRTEQAQKSMLKRFPIHHIPNGIDVSVFRPLDSRNCRTLLGLDPDKKIILFAAAKLSQINKGPDLLIRAVQALPATLKNNLVLLTLGEGADALRPKVEVPILDLGYVTGDSLKAIAYSAADLFVFPTRAESLPLVIQESMACGTPAVSFDVGGVPDLVRPRETGYLAPPEDVRDFANGIISLLEDNPLRERMAQRCREVIVKEYSLDLQVQRYLDLYNALLCKQAVHAAQRCEATA